jgi:hypothetical protein
VSVEADQYLPYDQPQELKALSLRISARLKDPDIAGVVFTHGTNTIEETAYLLNLSFESDRQERQAGGRCRSAAAFQHSELGCAPQSPQRNQGGRRPSSRGKGVLVVLNNEINAARDVTKTNTK